MIPTKWGQGQLFAFSALDGDSYFTEDFTGILSGDKIGINFYSRVIRSLYFTEVPGRFFSKFKAVTGDTILLDTAIGTASIIFAQRHLVIGETVSRVYIKADVQGPADIYKNSDGIEIHDTKDGEFTALYIKDKRFSFAYGTTQEEAVSLCLKGMELDIRCETDKKLDIYKKHSPAQNKYEALYAKCLSVMKTQLYSPEGNIKRIWSTPDRLPHRNMWLWDSVFHAIGHRHLNAPLAEDLILALFDIQREDGFIPHMIKPDYTSAITQPPVIAWGAWLVYEKSGNRDFLKTVLENNRKFLLWCRNNRRKSDKELYSWHTNAQKNNRCDESGMDNSPRFDTSSDLYAIDFSCYMANETRYMQRIAEELGNKEDAELFADWYSEIKTDINSTLWSEEDGFYYDYDITCGRMHKVKSVSGFLSLFAGVCDEAQAKSLLAFLNSPAEFGTVFPVPSIAVSDETFGTDMWRGPVWINYNYMIIKALSEYGFEDMAENLKAKTLDYINIWYGRTGTVYEFYDSENLIPPACFNRKGEVFEPYNFRLKYQTIRDYGWSITLSFDLLNEA